MVGKLSEKLEWMRNISLFTLFRPKEIAEGTYNIWPVSIGLIAGALCIFIVAIVLFKKRDLPLEWKVHYMSGLLIRRKRMSCSYM